MIELDLSGQWPGIVTAVGATMTERISGLWSAEIVALSDAANVDAENILLKAARLKFGAGDAARMVTGLVTALGFAGVLPDGQHAWRMRLEPGLSLFGRTRRSRVFCTTGPGTVADAIRAALSSGEGATSPSDTRFNLVSDAYPQRDMIVQYDETDLAFISRLAEGAGIFWLAGTDAGEETLLFGDENVAFPRLQGGSGPAGDRLPWRPRLSAADIEPALRAARYEQTVVTARATTNEWDPRTPARVLEVLGQSAAAVAVGVHKSAGTENYTDAKWGSVLARRRAEEASVHALVLSGEADLPTLAAGTVAAISDHPVQVVRSRDWLITAVQHRASSSVSGVEFLDTVPPPPNGYANTFTAIPANTPFRPARQTVAPRIDGLIRAVIDGTGAGPSRANLDPEGFYRVVFPFDEQSRPPGQSSCAVRLATPYGGPNEGLHFPLRPGAQVLLAFLNGDPDRPIIVGAVPDSVQKSVSAQPTRTVHTIRTASGVTMRINDGPGQ